MFITSALIGSTTDPLIANSATNVVSARIRITTWIRGGPSAAKSLLTASETTRASAVGGSTLALAGVKEILRNGNPATTISAATASATPPGRRMTALARRNQAPLSLALDARTRERCSQRGESE